MRIESMIELAKECGSEKELERASSQFLCEIDGAYRHRMIGKDTKVMIHRHQGSWYWRKDNEGYTMASIIEWAETVLGQKTEALLSA